MKLFLFATLLFTIMSAYAQPSPQLQSLVNAEKAFAQTSKEKSTKEAFIAYMADSGLIFQSGPVLGKKFWQDAKPGTGLLTWEPVFADISAAGDMGYTTGPWEFRTKRADTNAAAGGYFVSIWKKEKGEWKVALDIGISFPLSSQKEASNFSSKQSVTSKSKNSKEELLDKELEFIGEQDKREWNAYPAFMATDIRIYRPGSLPFITEEKRKQLFSEKDKKVSYKPTNTSVAPSGDLGYVYGKAVIVITSNDNTKTLNGNYLRIWKKEDGINWRIVLDLVNIDR